MYILLFFLITTLIPSLPAQAMQHQEYHPSEQTELTIAPRTHAKAPFCVCFIGQLDHETTLMLNTLKKDLESSDQFSVSIKTIQHSLSKKSLIRMAQDGFPLILFINKRHDGLYEWRLYDGAGTTMIEGKRFPTQGTSPRGWGHNLADLVWKPLTGQQSSFSSKIAYCMQSITPGYAPFKHIYLADYDGTHATPVVTTKTVNIAPRFNNDLNNPLLFYSETTNYNIRLIYISLGNKSQRKIASDCDGITMTPSFSPQGDEVVYAASKGKGSCQLYLRTRQGTQQLTNNTGNNVSPAYAGDHHAIYYCSDFATGVPQIYCYDTNTGESTPVTSGPGASYCPTYCPTTKIIAYVALTKGIFQIWLYNTSDKTHRQLTYDNDHKDECYFSPCGNYLIFCSKQGDSSRIALLNVLTGSKRFITPPDSVCSYPTWSACYPNFPEDYPSVVKR